MAPAEFFPGPGVDEKLDETELVGLAGRRILARIEHH